MNSEIKLILFYENVVLRVIAREDIEKISNAPGSDEYIIGVLLQQNKDIEKISEKELSQTIYKAWGLPRNFDELKLPYMQNKALLALVQNELRGRYRIGLVVSDMKSAKAALGHEYIDLFSDIITPEKVETNLHYFFDSTLHVVNDVDDEAAISGMKWLHIYNTPDALRDFLGNPKVHSRYIGLENELPPVAENLLQLSGKMENFGDKLKNIPKSKQYVIDIIGFAVVAIAVYFVLQIFFPEVLQTVLNWLNNVLSKVGLE